MSHNKALFDAPKPTLDAVDMSSGPMPMILGITLCMSIIDAYLTVDGLQRGILTEANPLWSGILGDGHDAWAVTLFYVLKLGLTGLSALGLLVASRYRPRTCITLASCVAMTYLLVCIRHIAIAIAAS